MMAFYQCLLPSQFSAILRYFLPLQLSFHCHLGLKLVWYLVLVHHFQSVHMLLFIIEFSSWFSSTVPIFSETLFLIKCISVTVNPFLLIICFGVFANLFAYMLSLNVRCFSRHILYVPMATAILGFKDALYCASMTPLHSSFDHLIRVAFWLISHIATWGLRWVYFSSWWSACAWLEEFVPLADFST